MPARELIGRDVGKIGNLEQLHGIADAALELVCRQPHLSRAKRDFLADRGTKELRIGVLEHKAHALMEPLGRRGILEICGIDRIPVEQVRTRVRKLKAVDKTHDRRLAAAVRTKQSNELPTVHLQ